MTSIVDLPVKKGTGVRGIFDGMVRNWKGVGRFVLGLPGLVEVLLLGVRHSPCVISMM